MGKILFMRKGEQRTNPVAPLPAGYTKLAYMQTSGTQYVNTLFSPNQNTKLEVRYQTTQSSACGIAVVDQSWQNNGFGVWGNAAVYGNSVYNSVVFYGDDPITMILDKGQLYKNGELVWTGTEATFQTPSNLTLMALNRNGSMAEYTSGKLYYCKLWDNDELVRDLVPCINDSGEVGLYDLVGRKFYGNAGTGAFTGSEVA